MCWFAQGGPFGKETFHVTARATPLGVSAIAREVPEAVVMQQPRDRYSVLGSKAFRKEAPTDLRPPQSFDREPGHANVTDLRTAMAPFWSWHALAAFVAHNPNSTLVCGLSELPTLV
jgi:hypothetical protein